MRSLATRKESLTVVRPPRKRRHDQEQTHLKAQTTIPQPVRAALRLQVGDELVYQIDGEQVIVTKARSVVGDDPFGTFSEWESDADRQAYADL